jgi:sterol 3beta-glucosyltransferase
MRIVLLTYGSLGDVQPFVALGAELRRAGYRVRLAAPDRFAALVAQHGLDVVGLPGDVTTISRELAGAGGNRSLRLMRALYRELMPLARRVILQLRAACRDADLIVHTFLLTSVGHLLAQERGIRDLSAQLFPMFAPTVHFPGMLAPTRSLGPALNYATHALATAIFRYSQRLSYAWLRRGDPSLGERPMPWPAPGRSTPLLFAFSPTLVPPPPDWGAQCYVTGAWHLPPQAYTPPEALKRFLAAGPPPISIGLGSMLPPDARRLAEVIGEALRRTNRRCVLFHGWMKLGDAPLPESVIAIDETPHDWLFPHLAGVIHHGGAGTTHAALRSGVPSVALPFGADQPFWAARMHRLGVGPAPLPAQQLSVTALAERIAALDDPAYRARAAAVGARVRAEDGVGTAIRLIEQQMEAR